MVTDDRAGWSRSWPRRSASPPTRPARRPTPSSARVEEICDQLVERRERWGISYLGLSATSSSPSPGDARLAGHLSQAAGRQQVASMAKPTMPSVPPRRRRRPGGPASPAARTRRRARTRAACRRASGSRRSLTSPSTSKRCDLQDAGGVGVADRVGVGLGGLAVGGEPLHLDLERHAVGGGAGPGDGEERRGPRARPSGSSWHWRDGERAASCRRRPRRCRSPAAAWPAAPGRSPWSAAAVSPSEAPSSSPSLPPPEQAATTAAAPGARGVDGPSRGEGTSRGEARLQPRARSARRRLAPSRRRRAPTPRLVLPAEDAPVAPQVAAQRGPGDGVGDRRPPGGTR